VDYLERFIVSSGSIARGNFHTFVEEVSSHCRELRAVSWNPRVGAADRAAFESSMQAQGSAGFKVTEKHAAGQLQPAAARAEYVPIAYIEPALGNETALGFDVASEPVRRRALEQARDTGRAAVTGWIAPVQDPRVTASVVIFKPVYRPPAANIDERRRHLQGFAAAVVNMGVLLREAVAAGGNTQIVARLLDISDPGAPSPVPARARRGRYGHLDPASHKPPDPGRSARRTDSRLHAGNFRRHRRGFPRTRAFR
jgi:CHASE1-domain containing sensor protein